MTVRDALREGAQALGDSGTPFLDASLLLAKAMGLGSAALYTAGPDEVGGEELGRYRGFLGRRASGEPVAYIVGYREFWGRRFAVDERVLVPRPETELLVEAGLAAGDALERSFGRPLRVHEAFCGSACVAISVAADRPSWVVSVSDLSTDALQAASANAAALIPDGRPGGPLALWRSDVLEAIGGPIGAARRGAFDLILANPPYVSSAETQALLARGWREPRMALDGGPDGLDLCRRLAPEAASRIAPGGALLVEADGDQASELRAILSASGFASVETLPDLAGRPRVTRARMPAAGGRT
jgi:release factor glutamine methyltransferase